MRGLGMRAIGWSAAATSAMLLGACHASPQDAGTITRSEQRQLNDAAAMLDANSVDANAIDPNASDEEQPQ